MRTISSGAEPGNLALPPQAPQAPQAPTLDTASGITPSQGTPEWLRTINDLAAFRLFLSRGPLSRTQLAEVSGMSKPTAGQMIQRLQRLGLIDRHGESSGTRGPAAITYAVRPDSISGVAIHVLEDSIEAVLVDPTGTEHEVAILPAAPVRTADSDVKAAIAAACDRARVDPASVKQVVVGVQAAVNEQDDALNFTDTLPGWPQSGARETLEEITGAEVTLDNDANLATLAERFASPALQNHDFVYLWLGVGVGAGLQFGGQTQRGHSGFAGEIGYLEVPRSAAALDPGAEDFTDLLGAPALMELLGVSSYARALEEFADNQAALQNYAERVALIIHPITALLDPARIIVGGPTGFAGGETLSALVQTALNRHTADDGAAVPTVSASTTGNHGVLQGARILLTQQIRSKLEERILDNS